MIADRLRSVWRTVNSRSSREAAQLGFAVDDLVDQIYHGLFDREPDPGGREAFRKFLADGLQCGSPNVAQMLRACIDSPEFRLRYAGESRAPIGITAPAAEEVFARFHRYEGPGRPG